TLRGAIIGGTGQKGKTEDRGVGTAVVIARAASHGLGPERAVETKGRFVSLLDLEKQLRHAGLAEHGHGFLQQRLAEAGAAATGRDRERQELGLVGRAPSDHEAGGRAPRTVEASGDEADRTGPGDEL